MRLRSLHFLVGVVLFAGAMAGCGGSSKPATQPGSTESAPSTTPASTTTGGQKQSSSGASFDFNSTADCLDQFSGSGAQRGSSGAAQTASVAVPKDSGWDSFLSVIVYVFPNASSAEKFGKGEDPAETIVTDNAVINGSAVSNPYSKQLVLGCLKP